MSVERTLESESLFNGNEENESVALDHISENRTASVVGKKTQKQPTLKEILQAKYISYTYHNYDQLADLKKRHKLDFGKNINRAVSYSTRERF